MTNTSDISRTLHIAIIGAGIGGLTAALALQRLGFRPTVYEQAPELGEVGAGLSLTPNASLALEHLGLTEFLRSEANAPLEQMVRHHQTGDILINIERHNVVDQYGAKYYQIHRSDLHFELLRLVQANDTNAVQLGYELESCTAGARGSDLSFRTGERVLADIVIGCDGLRSTVRAQLFDTGPPDFTGHVAWRALVPKDDLDDWYVEPASNTWAAPGRLFVHYPIRGTGLINCVAFSRSEEWEDEGWSIRADLNTLEEIFADFHTRVHKLIGSIPAKDCFKWGLFAREPLTTWNKGSVTLLGDAAHPMLPYFGSGAGMAIEDAVILSRCLEAESTIEGALARYVNARQPRTSFIQKEANLGGERLQRQDTAKLGKEAPRGEDSLGIFSYDATTVDI